MTYALYNKCATRLELAIGSFGTHCKVANLSAKLVSMMWRSAPASASDSAGSVCNLACSATLAAISLAGVSWHSPAARCSQSSHSPQERGRSPKNSQLCSVRVGGRHRFARSSSCSSTMSSALLRMTIRTFAAKVLSSSARRTPQLRAIRSAYGFVSECLSASLPCWRHIAVSCSRGSLSAST